MASAATNPAPHEVGVHVSSDPERGMQGDEGKWFQTYTGKQFFFYRPTPDMIDIEDIANSLSMQCRFGGHLQHHYSVAEHSVRVSYLVPAYLHLKALLHDASEAYLSDVVRPLKYSSAFENYFGLEDKITHAIFDKFGLDYDMPPDIKRADNIMLLTEHRDLRKPGTKLWDDYDKWGLVPLSTTLVPWSQDKAKTEFLNAFHRFTGNKFN
jgi:uncharacterized protein